MELLDLWRPSAESLSHWWVHHYVTSVEISEVGTIEITVRFPNELSKPYMDFFIAHIAAEVQRELIPAQAELRENEIFALLAPIRSTTEYAHNKKIPPEEVRTWIGRQAQISLPKDAAVIVADPRENASNWKIKGNPWTDLPASYKRNEFVLTNDLKMKIGKFDNFLSGSKGEIILLLGERGAGKTSFLDYLKERYEKQDIISLDVTPAIGPIVTAEQLFVWMYPRLLSKITNKPPPDEVEPEHFKTAVEAYHTKRPIILIDNLDRYTQKADPRLIQRFLQLSQGNLQAMKRKAIIVISASEKWKEDIVSADLGYLGKGSIWELQEFETRDVKALIENRLVLSESTFDHVFEPGAEQLVHTISQGNPRAILETCRWLSELAVAKGLPKVTKEFIRDVSHGDLQNRTATLIHETSKLSADSRAGLEGIFGYHLSVEKLNIHPDEAWSIFTRLVQRGRVGHDEVAPRMQSAVRHIALLKSDFKEGREEKYWAVSQPLKSFLAALKKKGLRLEEFVAFYRVRPITPPGVDHAALLRYVNKIEVEGEVGRALDTASELISEAEKEGTPPIRVVLKARFALESLIVAYLFARDIPLPPTYIAEHEEGWFENEAGYKRRKSFHRMIYEMRTLVSALIETFPTRLETFTYLKVVQHKSEDYCREDPTVRNWGKDDTTAVVSAIKKVYSELVKAIEQLNAQPPDASRRLR